MAAPSSISELKSDLASSQNRLAGSAYGAAPMLATRTEASLRHPGTLDISKRRRWLTTSRAPIFTRRSFYVCPAGSVVGPTEQCSTPTYLASTSDCGRLPVKKPRLLAPGTPKLQDSTRHQPRCCRNFRALYDTPVHLTSRVRDREMLFAHLKRILKLRSIALARVPRGAHCMKADYGPPEKARQTQTDTAADPPTSMTGTIAHDKRASMIIPPRANAQFAGTEKVRF